MNIKDLQYAVAVAEQGHFGRAAAQCNISQPALSGQIRKLEQTLGVTLFERTNRRVQITPVGERIVAQAKELLETAAAITATAAGETDPLGGPLRLGLIPTIGPYLAPRLLPAIQRGLPNAALHVSEAMTGTLETRLLGGELDAAVLATPLAGPHLDEIALYEEPFWIALPQGHDLEARDTIDLNTIDPTELLLLTEGHCLRDQVLEACGGQGAAAARTQDTSLATILALVGAGAGVTLVPAMSLAGSWVTDSGIALRKEASGDAARRVRLVFRKTFPRAGLLTKLADIICAIVPDTVVPERR